MPLAPAYLDRVHQSHARQVTVDEANARPDPLQREPQQQVLRAIRPIKRHHLIPLDTEIVHQPVADTLQVGEELPVSP